MAIFKLGALVTEIVGSIGGTTFRRGVQNPAIYNKSLGARKNTLLQNQQLNPISNIFRAWSKLDEAIRTQWNASALLFQFPDKFGVLRHITGRQLYTKLNTQLLPIRQTISNPSGINSDTYTFSILASWIKSDRSEAALTLITDEGENIYMIQAEVKLGELLAPTFTSRKVFYFTPSSGEEILDFTDEFFGEFPFFTQAHTAIFYVTAINNFGFKSTTLFDFADIDPD